MRRTIGVYGSSSPQPDEPGWQQAAELGQALARHGFDVMNGGHEGTMAAVSEAARAHGSRITGVTCRTVRDGRGTHPNTHLDLVIDSPKLISRIEILMRRASGYVFLPGGTGTFAELAIIWEHVSKGFVEPRPLVCVGPYFQPVVDLVTRHQSAAAEVIHVARDPLDAADYLAQHAVALPETERTFLGEGFIVTAASSENATQQANS